MTKNLKPCKRALDPGNLPLLLLSTATASRARNVLHLTLVHVDDTTGTTAITAVRHRILPLPLSLQCLNVLDYVPFFRVNPVSHAETPSEMGHPIFKMPHSCYRWILSLFTRFSVGRSGWSSVFLVRTLDRSTVPGRPDQSDHFTFRPCLQASCSPSSCSSDCRNCGLSKHRASTHLPSMRSKK